MNDLASYRITVPIKQILHEKSPFKCDIGEVQSAAV